MTERKARAKSKRQKQVPFGNDSKKSNGNGRGNGKRQMRIHFGDERKKGRGNGTCGFLRDEKPDGG